MLGTWHAYVTSSVMLNLFSPVLHSFIQQMFIDLLSVGCCCRCRRYSSEQNRQTFLPSQNSYSNGEAGQRCQMYRKNVQHVRLGFPGGASGRGPNCQCRRRKRRGLNPRMRKIPWRRVWQPTLVFLPRESHGQRSLAGYSPWGSQRVRHD